MTEARIETWQLGVGSEGELRVIRDAISDDPTVTDGARAGVAVEGSLRLEGDRILVDVRIEGAPTPPCGSVA